MIYVKEKKNNSNIFSHAAFSFHFENTFLT